jgi:hypothetical protein
VKRVKVENCEDYEESKLNFVDNEERACRGWYVAHLTEDCWETGC